MVNHRNKGMVNKINHIKESLNCILENGAYSDKNYQNQMNRKSDNYNEKEKLLVTMGYRYKQFNGEELQNQLFNEMINDKKYMEHLKINDKNLYENIIDYLKRKKNA
jgi:hypothetical protein